MNPSLSQYLHDRMQKTDTCWLWKGAVKNKYGKAVYRQKEWLAHRLSYEIHKGAIPEGLLVRHTCDNPLCVNPEHLLLGTHQDNSDDKLARNRQLRGMSINTNVLCAAEVRQLLDLTKSGMFSLRKLASLYNIHHSTVYDLVSGRTWKHLQG